MKTIAFLFLLVTQAFATESSMVIAYSAGDTKTVSDSQWHEMPLQFTNNSPSPMYIYMLSMGINNSNGECAIGRLARRSDVAVLAYPMSADMDAASLHVSFAPNYFTLKPGDGLDFALLGVGNGAASCSAWIYVYYTTGAP